MAGPPAITIRTLTDGGQQPPAIADAVVAFVEAAQRSLNLALYDVRLPGAVGDRVAGALRAAAGRGVAIRLIYNFDDAYRVPVPPPPQTQPEIIEALGLPTRPIPGKPDLMHHKYLVRDGEAVWTGSTNWTLDSWTREENVIVTVASEQLAAAFTADFEQLWEEGDVERSGFVDPDAVTVGDATVRAWFSPGRGTALAHRIAGAIDRAARLRIASPVITAAPILATLAETVSDDTTDLAGVVDHTQMLQVVGQWHANGNAAWKVPLLERVLEWGGFSGKRSTPYAPGAVHDYMHAKVTVADDTVFVGSYNLSKAGTLNAENVLEIEHAGIAGQLAAFIDEVRARYPKAEVPGDHGGEDPETPLPGPPPRAR
jgi:phosphatidylserine/phosphatidylglycerophosphate/cardiolipin synthase-like enzyme